MCSFFEKKDIEECLNCNPANEKLKRTLSSFNLIIMGVGAIIGAGIFIVVGEAAAISGPSVALSFVIAGIVCCLTALCYAEMASMISVTGGIYTYTYITMGEIWAWLVGWIGILQYTLAASVVAIGWASYTKGFLDSIGLSLPTAITTSFLSGDGILNLPAFLLVIIITGILILGAKESAKFNGAIVAVKLVVISLFIIIGAQYINPVNYQNFAPNGLLGIFDGAALVFFAYLGFDSIAAAAEETKNPQRSLPIGILGSLAICSILYILVSVILTGMVHYSVFKGSTAPVQLALQSVGINWAMTIVTIGVIAGLTTVVLINMFVAPRLIFAISRDNMLPMGLTNVNSKFQSPTTSILLVGIVSAIIAAFSPENIFAMVNIAALVMFIFLATSVIILRKRKPDIPRKFKCPLVPLIPILSIIACLILIIRINPVFIEAFGIWLILGLIFYFLYKKHKSTREINKVKK